VILYPAIDIRGGQAVRLLRGDYNQETVYDADPADAARRFSEAGAEFLHVVDLDGAREGSPANLDAVRRIATAAGCPIEVGGGLRDRAALDAVLEAGAERVVIGTAALRDRPFLASALESHGERIVVSVDARAGRVSLAGWTEASDAVAAEAVAALEGAGVRRFLFTPIEVDGTMEGPGMAELGLVAAATSSEILYSGGIGDLGDLRRLAGEAAANVTGVIVGRALYEGRFGVAEARRALAGPSDS
jgi:phosphoribosylformimino-5-aminoimidazole carboxamide ribotide isomerase